MSRYNHLFFCAVIFLLVSCNDNKQTNGEFPGKEEQFQKLSDLLAKAEREDNLNSFRVSLVKMPLVCLNTNPSSLEWMKWKPFIYEHTNRVQAN